MLKNLPRSEAGGIRIGIRPKVFTVAITLDYSQ